MVVEIKGTDSVEEIDKKLRAIKVETDNRKKERLMKYFGSIKADVDPVELQRQWRNEWN